MDVWATGVLMSELKSELALDPLPWPFFLDDTGVELLLLLPPRPLPPLRPRCDISAVLAEEIL